MTYDISVVCSCRNDNYGENLLDRLYYFLRSVERFTIPIEIIIVEWNPLENYESMFDIISRWNALVPFQHPVRIITVSKDNHERFIGKFKFNTRCNSFQEYPAKNVGFRHARGKYIIQTNPDIFFPLSTIKFIENLITTTDIKSVISAGRPRGKRVDLLEVNNFPSIVNSSTSIDITNGINNMEQLVLTPKNIKIVNECALGDFMLFKREHALLTKSFKEFPIAIHHHEQPFVDEFIKIGLNETPIDGITIYHFDHSRVSYEKVNEQAKNNPISVTLEFLRSVKNDDNWGCNDLQLSEVVISA